MNVLQNMLFLGSLGKVSNKAFSAEEGLSFGFSDAIESGGKNVFGALTKKIGNESVRKAADKTLGTAFLMGSEAIEEGIQRGIGTYAQKKFKEVSPEVIDEICNSSNDIRFWEEDEGKVRIVHSYFRDYLTHLDSTRYFFRMKRR